MAINWISMIKNGTRSKSTTKADIRYPFNDLKSANPSLSPEGRIYVNKKGWIIRLILVSWILFFVIYRLLQGSSLENPFILYSTLIPTISIVTLVGAWFLYKNPGRKIECGNELVSVIIPIYNQKNMIREVIDAVYRSNYENIEVIAINDGSTDGTKDILDSLKDVYPSLNVIHQNRGGKRKASATGFYASTGKYLVHIDSDSVLNVNAISEIMKAFKSNPKIGTIVGDIRMWNGNKSVLTKLQDVWHNVSCNINKAYESAFGCVTCCSGSLSAFRREAIEDFMPYWRDSNSFSGGGVDRELTAYVMGSKKEKTELINTLWSSSSRQKLMESTAKFDDADDRMLTAHSLTKWESAYVITAFTHVEGQETFRGFIKQQIRWKKGFLRTNFYLSTFFWKGRNPIASTIYYLDLIASLTTPMVILIVMIYEPLVLGLFWLPLAFLGGIIFSAFAQGVDMKLRWPQSRIWVYMPLMSLFGTFVLSWLLFAALWNYNKNSWMTR